jgi:hypothetical protein
MLLLLLLIERRAAPPAATSGPLRLMLQDAATELHRESAIAVRSAALVTVWCVGRSNVPKESRSPLTENGSNTSCLPN